MKNNNQYLRLLSSVDVVLILKANIWNWEGKFTATYYSCTMYSSSGKYYKFKFIFLLFCNYPYVSSGCSDTKQTLWFYLSNYFYFPWLLTVVYIHTSLLSEEMVGWNRILISLCCKHDSQRCLDDQNFFVFCSQLSTRSFRRENGSKYVS